MAESSSGSQSGPAPGRSEARTFPRFRIDGARVSLAKPGLLAKLGLGLRKQDLVNLSQGGVLLRTATCLEVGARVRMRIDIPRWKERIECEGEVRWSAQGARAESEFYAGLRFLGLPPLDAQRIAKMCEMTRSFEYRAMSSAHKDPSGTKRRTVKN